MVTRRRLVIAICALILGQLIGALNATLITAAIPAIIDDLDSTAVLGSWLMTAAAITITVSSPIWGRIGDQANPVNLLRISLVALLVAATVAATAQDPIVLLAARVLWAISLTGVTTLTMILFALLVSPRERGKYMGWISAVTMLGQMGGPLIGGLIVESALGWRGVFAVAAPVGIIILVLLQLMGKIERESPVEKSRIDFLGGFLLAGGIAVILVYVSFSGSAFAPTSTVGLALLGVGIVALAIAMVVEFRHQSPVLPLRAMRGRVPLLTALAVLGVGMTTLPVTVYITLYFQSGRGLSPTMSGLLVAATAIGSVLSSFVVGYFAARTGRLRRFLIGGAVLLVAGAIGISLIGPGTALWWLAVILFVLGIAQGATVQFTYLAAQNAVPVSEVGAMSGFMHFIQSLGGAVLLAVFGMMLQIQLDASAAQGVDQATAYAEIIPRFFPVVVVVAVVALIAYMLLPSIRLRSTIDKTEDEPTEVAESVIEEIVHRDEEHGQAETKR